MKTKIKILNALLLITVFFAGYLLSCSSINKPAVKTEKLSYIKTESSEFLTQLPIIKKFGYYKFDKSVRLTSRVISARLELLNYLNALDETDIYTNYTPTDFEIQIIDRSFAKLPDYYKKILDDKLIAIYFIKNFTGSGYTEYVIGEDNKVYLIMIINPDVFNYNISEWLTIKENTCFDRDDFNWKISIDCGSEYSGFLYILLHEASHILDYTQNFTPYVEEDMTKIPGFRLSNKKFTDNIWLNYNTPRKPFDFNERTNISFYGLSGAPKIKISDALQIYEQLQAGIFVSLYGSKNWAEDFAEYATFYYLTQSLKQPYKINIIKNNLTIKSIEPFNNPEIWRRGKSISKIFK